MAEESKLSNIEKIVRFLLILPLLLVGLCFVADQLLVLAKYQGARPGILRAYDALVSLFQAYPWIAWPATLVLAVACFLVARRFLRWINQKVIPFVYGTATEEIRKVPFQQYDIVKYIKKADADTQFLGLDPDKKPHFLNYEQRTHHIHCLGQTGTGKTKSIILPLAFQDMLRGKGMLIVDAKAEENNFDQVMALAELANRADDLKMFSLEYKDRSHTYNPFHIPENTDPVSIVSRVFETFEMENPYYRDQSRMFLQNMVAVLHGTEENGAPSRFSVRDLIVLISSESARQYYLDRTSDRNAAFKLRTQLEELGERAGETLTGLKAALDVLDIDLLLSCDPDIVLRDALEQNQIVYFGLPSNKYKTLAPIIGKVVLQDLQECGATRQLNRKKMNQDYFPVFIDEFYSFAYEGFIDAVNKLRDANVPMFLAHQSISDLERVSPEFSKGIWDNTRLKIILYQNDPELCEKVSKSMGTEMTNKRTARHSAGALLTVKPSLEFSDREVEEFRLHPNRIKSLHKHAQGFFIDNNEFVTLNFSMLTDEFFEGRGELKLPKKKQGKGIDLFSRFVDRDMKVPEDGNGPDRDPDPDE